jgi:hypothetical protein
MSTLVDNFEQPPAFLVEALEHETKKLGGDWGEALINVSVAGTFAGLTVRDMAEQVALGDEYRQIYQPASGVTHGEWWSIEDDAMVRCMNPLHRFHLIASLDAPCSVTPPLALTLTTKFESILKLALNELARDAPDEKQGAT